MLKKFMHHVRRITGREQPPPPEEPAAAAPAGERKAKVKQVLEAPPVAVPGFAQGVPNSDLLDALRKHITCRYKPHLEQQRIYRPGRRLPGSGDLQTEYEGLSATCPSIKKHGLAIAQQDGYVMPYRYVDLNHIYAHCCGNFAKCRFFERSQDEEADFKKASSRPGGGAPRTAGA